jgi:GT2 family glycosyltransferase
VAELEFPRVERPLVSVLMVTHNAVEWVQRALSALRNNTPRRYELIVVDNASSDGTRKLLAGARNARITLEDRNHGFGAANNLAAASARGRYLALLNSDALVPAGWLSTLVETIEADPRIAAVGPKLLNLDGSLQLAGALVARTGSTLEYGYGDDADRPAYSFPRDVDYTSAACLLLRRSAFEEVGGFDPAYGLGYFEDADLCLAFGARGYRVVYDPRIAVTHARGASGIGPELGALALRNRGLFERRWRKRLAARPFAPLERRPRRIVAARDALADPRILVLGEPAVASRLAALWPTGRVTLIATDETSSTDLLKAGIEVVGSREDWRTWFAARRFQFDAVVGRAGGEIEAQLVATQPCAERLEPTDALADALTAAGAAPPNPI